MNLKKIKKLSNHKKQKDHTELKIMRFKKIIEEGWKVGYMERNEPVHERDSGWSFLAGNEDDKYIRCPGNIALMDVGAVWQQFDPDIFKYIDMPVGTRLIRISSDAFEIDKNDK